MRKFYGILALLILLLTGLSDSTAQSLKSLCDLSENRTSSRAIDRPNLWFGSQVQLPVLGDKSDFDLSFGVSTQIIFNIISRENFNVSLVGNIAPSNSSLDRLAALAMDDDGGLSVGIQPFYVIGGSTQLTFFGQGLVKWTELQPQENLQTYHLNLGFDLSFPVGIVDSPLAIGVTGKRVFSEDSKIRGLSLSVDGDFWVFTATGIIPIAEKTGLAVQAIRVPGSDLPTQVLAGVIINTGI